MNDVIKVILADDHPVVRRGLAAIVDAEDDIQVVGEADNGEKVLALVHKLKPDVVLMDLQMPVLDGVAATKRIRTEAPATEVIILTTFKDDDFIYAGIAAGARGYLLKDAPPDRLVEAIRAAYRGEVLLNPEVAARVLDRLSSMINPTEPSPAEASVDTRPSLKAVPPKLTPRELDVLKLMARGLRNKEIADELVIAERTVKIHVGNILGKLQATNRTEAVAVALNMGLLTTSDR